MPPCGVLMDRSDIRRFSVLGVMAMMLILGCRSAFALDPSLKPSQYLVDNWQIPEGLPQTSAQAIARTPDGYLWIGTQEGLARFDGVRFSVFLSGKDLDIPNKHISTLFVDAAGRLLVALVFIIEAVVRARRALRPRRQQPDQQRQAAAVAERALRGVVD